MVNINENFFKLKESYLFTDIAKKVQAFSQQHPEKKIIRLGIGDVTLPLCDEVVNAMHQAVSEMGQKETFHGYGPEQGYAFLREAIAGYYKSFGVNLQSDEILISDGAKSDIGNITDLFAQNNVVLVPDPVYPVYVDTNLMNGRQIVYMNANAENGFLPMPDEAVKADIIYLCSPNNPTGSVYSKEQLQEWVSYAKKMGAIILFDAAYEAFVADPSLPRSIYCIEEAKECAIEFCSFSKTAGFTGTRCGYTVVPHALKIPALNGQTVELNKWWVRRQTTKFNGVPYIIQKGAAAVFTQEGQRQIKQNIAYYMQNANTIANALREKGVEFFGGVNSPYIWLKCPGGMTSWEFFDFLLHQGAIVGTPGSGFGQNGEGFFRLTAFGDHENTLEAMWRLKRLL